MSNLLKNNTQTLLNYIDKMTRENYISKINYILDIYQQITSEEKYYGISKQKYYSIFYTNYQIAYKITEETFKSFNKNINNTLFFEPSVGLGIFVVTYLDYIRKHFNNYDINKIINNIYISDIDKQVIPITQRLVNKFISLYFNDEVKLNHKNIHIGNTIINDDFSIKSVENLFGKEIKFDFVLSNPPYKNIKVSKKDSIEIEYQNYKMYSSKLSKSIKKQLALQEGTINLYKVFFELILMKYTKEDASIGIIIPYTILSDKSTIKFRKKLLEMAHIEKIYYIEEKSNQFKNITQAMCFFALKKTKTNNKEIQLINFENSNYQYKIYPKLLSKINTNYSFHKIEKESYKILEKIHKFKKLKNFLDIKNLRGELDLTIDKKYLTVQKTKYMLLQGKNIKKWNYMDNSIYVNENFLESKNSEKFEHIKKERIICQQISNISSKQRLKFTKIPKDIIVANSCNYIISYSISMDYLLGIFNSYLFDWRFRLFNSNNHISNYELDDLPICICDNKNKKNIIKYVKDILNGNDSKIIDLNLLIFTIYGLNPKEIKIILSNYNDIYIKKILEKIEGIKIDEKTFI